MNTVLQQLAPHGTLRAALNLSNFLLVSGQTPDGDWQGVAPDLARAIATRLGADLQFVPYKTPGELADAADTGAWTIGMIGADPARAEKIRFSAAYAEIEASYLVPPGSALQHADEVDRPGNRIAVYARSAYDVWLVRNIRHAQLLHAGGFDEAFDRFRHEGLEALACLRPKLMADADKWPGSRILEGRFMTIQQAVGCSRKNTEAAEFLQGFVEEAKASGLVAGWISKHQAQGLSVAPASMVVPPAVG
ncbi:MAG: transporter substrate-binding domain-containing protein [Burkholderiaceae bacterium]|nr:transporter substrate-binding domain-containing protein [Burkholderiaceae bacterium]